MNKLVLPEPLCKAYAEIWKRTLASGREIDLEFIRRGFVSVKAEIEFFHRVYGPKSYEVFLESQANETGFESFRTYDGEVLAKLSAAERSSPSDLNALWGEVLEDSQLDCFSKQGKLRRFFPSRIDALLEPYLPALMEAVREEHRQICRLYREPPILLRDSETAPLRKEVYNAVMADAYGALGFSVFKRKRNLDIYAKVLTPDYAIIVEADATVLQRHHSGMRTSPTAYWPLMIIDSTCYLGSPKKQDARRWMTFLPVSNCIASDRRSRYEDTSSLEVSIRANALWYELTIAPFEHFILEYGKPG
jgi:hypothetical protein